MHIVRHFEVHKTLYSSATDKIDIVNRLRAARAEEAGVPVYAVSVDQFEAEERRDVVLLVRVSTSIHGEYAHCVVRAVEAIVTIGRDRAMLKDSEVETPYPDYIADLGLSGEAFLRWRRRARPGLVPCPREIDSCLVAGEERFVDELDRITIRWELEVDVSENAAAKRKVRISDQ